MLVIDSSALADGQIDLGGLIAVTRRSNAAFLSQLRGEQATLDARALQQQQQQQQQQQLLVGSQDATTCLVAVVACQQSGMVWAAHIDTHLRQRDVAALTAALQRMTAPQLYLAGAYCDVNGTGPGLASSVLQQLHDMDEAVQLQLCCVAQANTRPDGAPHTCSLFLDIQAWTPHAAVAADRGPQLPRRFAAQHCRRDPRAMLTPVWNTQRSQLALPAFDPSCVDAWELQSYERMLAWPDAKLLSVMSTSPLHEPPWFAQDMRNALRFLMAAQHDDSAEQLEAATAARYRLVGGQWQRMPAEQAQRATAAAAASVSGGT